VKIRAHSIDYSKDRGAGGLVNRGFWLDGIPRPLLACRAFGHRPVVDGTGPYRPGLAAHRWVCCDRCGVRPEPQGSLHPDLPIGQAYTGAYDNQLSKEAVRGGDPVLYRTPGPWPADPTWDFGGQLVVGGGLSGPGVEVKVGHAGSEHTLASHVTLGRAGALFLHSERLGTWLQRRLNPTGYQSRVIGAGLHDGRLHWQLWARRDESSREDPKWMQGSVLLDPVERLLGPKRYGYTDDGQQVPGLVRMPHGDDHDVMLQLQRQTYGRRNGRKKLTWIVEVECPAGIPTRPHSGGVTNMAVPVPDSAVPDGDWPAAAAAAVAVKLTADRARRGWRPSTVDGG
jgi:hypothetical protein